MPDAYRLMSGILAFALSFCLSANAEQTAIFDKTPQRIDPGARYLIYLHGKIIEDQGRRPTHPDWGVYEYQAILNVLARSGVMVISEQRRSLTDMDVFAQHVADQVRQLLRAGVSAEHISVVGFSKGGGIAMRTSVLLHNPRVNFVFLAACGDGDFGNADMKVAGRILSIYEASDEIGRSCASLFAKPGVSGQHSEIEIRTGEHHGAFFRPRSEWLTPALGWVRRE